MGLRISLQWCTDIYGGFIKPLTYLMSKTRCFNVTVKHGNLYSFTANPISEAQRNRLKVTLKQLVLLLRSVNGLIKPPYISAHHW